MKTEKQKDNKMNLVNEGVLPPNEPDDRDERREEREMAQERATLADIVAEMRHDAELCHDLWLNDPNNNSQSDSFCEILNGYARRIEAAWKRERDRLMTEPRSWEECVERAMKVKENSDVLY